MRDLADVVDLWDSRRAAEGAMLQRMRTVAAHYHDDVIMPLPELDGGEDYSTPNLIAQGIDQFAYRVSSVLPDMTWPALDPAKTTSVRKAQDRRSVAFSWWHASGMKRQLEQRAKWLRAYGSAPSLVTLDYERMIPRYEARNPAMVLPGHKSRPWDVEVEDVLFSYTWTLRELSERYGITFDRKTRSGYTTMDAGCTVECIQYLDHDQWALVVLGPAECEMRLTTPLARALTSPRGREYSDRRERGISDVISYGNILGNWGSSQVVVLENEMHDLGICPASVPGKFGLERLQGAVDSMVGLRKLQGKLMALEVLSVERGIFPNEWAILDPTGNSQVVKLADGRSGVVGEIRGGTMQVTNVTPGQMTMNTINYLERAQRMNGLLPQEWGGESTSNIRTGRRGEQVLSATVDQSIRADHELFAAALEHENRIAVAWAKKLKRPVTVYVSRVGGGGKQPLSYTARDLFETDRNEVAYSQAGADISQLIVNSAQMQGTELISQDTARRMNPLIDDPDHEKAQVAAEKIDRAIFAGFEQSLVTQQIALPDAVYIRKLMREGVDIGDAIEKAQERAQERQASSGVPGEATGPVEPGSPEAQPGLQPVSPAAAGMAEPTGPVTGPGQEQTDLAGLLRALQTTRRAANA